MFLHISDQAAVRKIFHHQFCAKSTYDELKNKVCWNGQAIQIGNWLVIIKCSLTCTVADAHVFDNIVTVQGAGGLDLSLKVCHVGLFVSLKFLDSNKISSVITQRIISTKFDAAKVTLNTHMHTVKTHQSSFSAQKTNSHNHHV